MAGAVRASFACMRVQLLLFAAYRDLAGTSAVDLELADGATAGTAVAALRGLAAGFAALPERPAVAVNSEVVGPEQPLQDGDEVALLPPVAGG
jgi:MoaE-MoaD fusion protein